MKWYQTIANDNANNTAICAAFFGRMNCELHDTVDETGRLTNCSNPWTIQVANDLDKLNSIDSGRELLHEAKGSITAFFKEPIASAFLKIDLTELRARELTKQIPPQDYVRPPIPIPEPDIYPPQPDDISKFICESPDCGLAFDDKGSLFTHIRRSHGYCNALHFLTITNQ